MFKVLKRRITKAEAKLLIAEIKLTPNIIGYSLQEWLKADHVMVAEDSEGALVGACLNYDFCEDWRKIAALIVVDKFRGRGIGRMLFYESFNDAQQDIRNVYTISSNPIIIKMMDDLGFVKFENFFKLTQTYRNYESLFYCHTIQWAMNLYRLQEIIRKSIVYQEERDFIFGVKFYEESSDIVN